MVQVFLAGFAIFVDPLQWDMHVNFIKIIEYVPILMLVAGFTGRLPGSMHWQSLTLFLLIVLMYATANLTNVLPVAGAFHPVIALAMFGLTAAIVPQAWQLTYKKENNVKE